MTPTQPRPKLPDAGPTAIGALAGLAAELNQRGYTTEIITSRSPYLTLECPGISQPRRIYADEEWFCWFDPDRPYGRAPFSLRSIPLCVTAGHAHRVMRVLIRAYRLRCGS